MVIRPNSNHSEEGTMYTVCTDGIQVSISLFKYRGLPYQSWLRGTVKRQCRG